ncbi:hypothetical protein Droror1_Dr00001143 [Drosera rotundifolia]
MIIPVDEGILEHKIPQTDSHVVRAGHDEVPGMGGRPDLADGVVVTVEDGEGGPEGPDIPNPKGLVDGGGDEAAVVVLVPVAGEDLVLVGGDDDGGGGLADIPDAEGAVAGSGGEDVGVTGVPGGGVDAVGVLGESAEGGGAVSGPQLDGVIPRGGQEGIAAGGVPVGRVHLAGVLMEGSHRVRLGRQGHVVQLQGPVGHCCHEQVVVRFRPREVVHAVRGVERHQFRDGRNGRRRRGRHV